MRGLKRGIGSFLAVRVVDEHEEHEIKQRKCFSRLISRVGTVLAFSVFFGFRAFELFIRVLGRAFGPDLLRERAYMNW